VGAATLDINASFYGRKKMLKSKQLGDVAVAKKSEEMSLQSLCCCSCYAVHASK